MTISSDGITRDISAEEAVPWQPRKLDELARDAAPTPEEQLESANRSGYQQGYSDALAESGKKEAAQIAKIHELLRYLGQPLASVDETLKQSILSLAAEMASHIVDREIGTDHSFYRTQLDQLSDKLPAQVRVTSLRLRPEKARALREMRDAAKAEADSLPEIVDDPELAGDVCLACWQESAIDISLQGRLASIVQSYCGDNTSEALAVKIETTATGDAAGEHVHGDRASAGDEASHSDQTSNTNQATKDPLTVDKDGELIDPAEPPVRSDPGEVKQQSALDDPALPTVDDNAG